MVLFNLIAKILHIQESKCGGGKVLPISTFNNLLPKVLLPVPKNLNSTDSEILVPKRMCNNVLSDLRLSISPHNSFEVNKNVPYLQ